MSASKKSILIVLIAGIGDLVLASKSIRAIRNGFPAADIYLLTSTEASAIAKNYGYVDHVRPFPIRELRDAKTYIFEMLKLVRKLRKNHFHLVVNLYRIYSWRGSAAMAFLFALLKATTKVGHDHKGFGIFLDKKAPASIYKDHHFADAMMDIAHLAGGVPDNKGIEVFWDKESERKWDHLFSPKKHDPSQILVGINPGGDRANRRWNPNNYAMVSDQLLEQFNASVVILGGPGEEEIARHVQLSMKHQAVNLAGQLTLNDLVYITSKFDLLITNDSGPMHIAAAVKTPLVAIFGPENPELLGPYASPNSYRVVTKDVDCRPCNKKNCERPICLDLITAEEVLEKCIDMLEMRNAPTK